MKQLFFHELKQNLTDDLSKNIFIVKRMKNVFPINIIVNKNSFSHLRINI